MYLILTVHKNLEVNLIRPIIDLPLRKRGGHASDRALLLRRLAQVRAPRLPAALDQVVRHPALRAVQVPIHHGVQGETEKM